MASGSPSALSVEDDDEFRDKGMDWAKAGTLVDTAEKMQAAAEREEKIEELTKEAKGVLQEIATLRRGKCSGRPTTTQQGRAYLKLGYV